MPNTGRFADDIAERFWREPLHVDRILPDLGDGPLDTLDDEFRLMLDGLPVACWMARGDGYLCWVNRRLVDYTGVAAEQLCGWEWGGVHDPKHLDAVVERWSDSIERGEPFEMVFPIKGADGKFRPFLTRIVPLRDATGAVKRWFGVNTEVGSQVTLAQELAESRSSYAILTEAMPQMVWSTRADGYHDYFNQRWYEFTGTERGDSDGEVWRDIFHPDDQERIDQIWSHSLKTGDLYEIEYRLRRADGDWRWVLGRAYPVRNEAGEVTRWIGTCTDIHDAKLAAEQSELFSRELSHRIKNIFAVIVGLISMSSRQFPGSDAFASDLKERVLSLSRAHEFARPHSPQSAPITGNPTLMGMLQRLMEPYQGQGEPRVALSGDDVDLDDQAATPIALIYHELATNAAKYGALSTEQGKVSLHLTRIDDNIRVEWKETGGPAIEATPTHAGFGTRLADLSVKQQLGGKLARDWSRDGLNVTLEVPINRLNRNR